MLARCLEALSAGLGITNGEKSVARGKWSTPDDKMRKYAAKCTKRDKIIVAQDLYQNGINTN